MLPNHSKKRGKLFSIYSTILLFPCNYDLSICNCYHKVSIIPFGSSRTSFSGKRKMKSLSGYSPDHFGALAWSKRFYVQNLLHPGRILPKILPLKSLQTVSHNFFKQISTPIPGHLSSEFLHSEQESISGQPLTELC